MTSVSASAGGKNYKNEYTYEKDRLATVKHNTTGDSVDVRYSFSYAGLGRQTTVKVDNPTNSGAGSQVLSTKVYEAAELVGYQDTAYFSSQFKKVVGISPSEYQSRCR